MKKVILSVAVVVSVLFTSCKNEAKKETKDSPKIEAVKTIAMTNTSFGVRGNCGMCKNTIEKAANGVAGVTSAVWDRNKKKIDVSFDESKTNVMAIHNAIAASGYDTEKVAGNEEAYNGLPGCCKYDHSMLMNQSGENSSDDHSNHDH